MTSHSRFGFNHSNSSLPNQEHQQTNPFLLQQQRLYQQQQQNQNTLHFNSYSRNSDNQDGGQLEAIASSASPINYFFDKVAATFISSAANNSNSTSFTTTQSSVILGDTDNSFEDTSDYNYYLMNSGGPSFTDNLEVTTSLPSNFTNSSHPPNPLDIWWNVFDEKYLRHSMNWTVALIIAYTLILIIGIIGNCMVILVVVFRPQMRTVTNMFIMNLAVADLFVIVFCVPGTLVSNIFTPWILGSFMCKGVAYVQGVSVCASAYSLVAISMDRCKAIYRPMERPRGLSRFQALFTICLIWIVALLLTIPWAVIFDVTKSEKDGLTYCVETWENKKHGQIYFLVANLICCYSLPLILISLSNVVIWCHVSHRKVPQDSASISTIKRMHRRTRHGVRKMLGIVTLAFLVSWLPLYILATRVKFSKSIGEWESNLLDILMPLAQWLGSWNSSINPVLYAFLNSKFREMFKSLLPSWVPFVHQKNSNMIRIARNNMGRGTVTNGTFTGNQRTPSYTTVFTARSTRSTLTSNNSSSRRFRQQRPKKNSAKHNNNSQSNHRTLLVSSFRREVVPNSTPPQTPVPIITTVTAAATIVGNGAVVTTTTTALASTAAITASSSTTQAPIITDL